MTSAAMHLPEQNMTASLLRRISAQQAKKAKVFAKETGEARYSAAMVPLLASLALPNPATAGDPDFPSGFTRVSAFNDWTLEGICRNSANPPPSKRRRALPIWTLKYLDVPE